MRSLVLWLRTVVAMLIAALPSYSAARRSENTKSKIASAELPNIIDILGRLPPPPSSLVAQAKQSRSRNMTVAICSTGHFRTFTLPGMYSSFSTQLLKTVPGSADLYLVGHVGNVKGSANAKQTIQMDGPITADDEHLKEALKHLELSSSDQVEITLGDCNSLERGWVVDGISNRTCINNARFMQMMWLDHCVRRVRNSGKRYDLVLRTRPDVGIFKPFPWDKLSSDKVTYMQKDGGTNADWFFSMPWPTINRWWDKVAELYGHGFDGLPDYTMWGMTKDVEMTEANFPVVIVRGNRSAQCFRIVTDFALQQNCEEQTAKGFWERLHPHGTTGGVF